MTQTKLEIIGPYTPEHEGPFCTRDGRSVRIICTDCVDERPIIGLVIKGTSESTRRYYKDGSYLPGGIGSDTDLMNAREIPEAREFWINESYDGDYVIFEDKSNAILSSDYQENHKRTIHVREVLPGDE